MENNQKALPIESMLAAVGKMPSISHFILLSTVPMLIQTYTDMVEAPVIQLSFESTREHRAENLDSNVRLLTVLALQNNGWRLFRRHWYKLFEEDLMWIPAENFCRSMGGHLASIVDIAENNFIHQLRKKSNIWIGLNKLNDTEQVYKWSDGQDADFLNWDSTQPNQPKVDCTYMAYQQDERMGTWFDYGCHEQMPNFFVCKIESP